MPNWCDGELSVQGEPEILKRFVETVKGEKEALDANKLIPYPEEWRKLDKLAQEWQDRWDAFLRSAMDSEGKIDDEKRKELWKKFIAENGEQPEDGYNRGGYEWCIENWGTKWGFCHVEVFDEDIENGCVEYGFQTAWSPPIPLVKKMGEMFPELAFQLRYWECGAAFQGVLTIREGKVVDDWSGEYIGSRGG